MTANRSVIATAHPAGQTRRHLAWARRENDRRRRAYDAEIEAWQRREDRLLALRIEAAGFIGCTEPRTGLPVELDDDEVVYRVLPTAELVEAEARHMAGLPAPDLTVAAVPVELSAVLPHGLRVVDIGTAVVTDRRVAFGGRAGRREWSYRDLRGPGHHPNAPVTLLHTAHQGPLAGLRVPANGAVNFRFYLTLAFAAASGRRAAVVAQLETLLAAHHDARPLPPAPVTPQDAPTALIRPERLSAAAAVAVALTLAAFTTGTSGPASPSSQAEPETGAVAGAAEGPRGFGGALAHPSAGPAAPRSRPVPSPAAVSVPLPTAGTPGEGGSAPWVPGGPTEATTPAVVPTGPAPTAPPASTATAPATTPPAAPAPSPSATTPPPAAPADSPPAARPGAQVCRQPLPLPPVDPSLCPPADG